MAYVPGATEAEEWSAESADAYIEELKGCYPEPSLNQAPWLVPRLETLRAALLRLEPVDLLNRHVVTQITGDPDGFDRVVMTRARQANQDGYLDLPVAFRITAMYICADSARFTQSRATWRQDRI